MTADRFIMGGMPDNDYHDAMEKRLAAPTEQTEAQDDKEVTPLYSAIITDMCDEIESLRAQLEAARGESKRTTDACAKYEVQLEQKMQEHQDALSEMRGRMEGAERDAERLRAVQDRRIALTPEWQAGWSAEIFDEESDPVATGVGFTVQDAIDAALSPPSAGAV